MNDLILEKTKNTLGINCNVMNGKISIEGSSYPEDAMTFFNPLFDWIEEYISKIKKNMQIDLIIDYLNTSSIKCIIDFLEILEEYYKTGKDIIIIWHYKKNDIDMMETGEEFQEQLEVPFEIVIL